jgi:hypothetical protein
LLLLLDNLITMTTDQATGDRTYRTSDQRPFGCLIVLVIPDNASDHGTRGSTEQGTIPGVLLSSRFKVHC